MTRKRPSQPVCRVVGYAFYDNLSMRNKNLVRLSYIQQIWRGPTGNTQIAYTLRYAKAHFTPVTSEFR
jgi:hypothetical protein